MKLYDYARAYIGTPFKYRGRDRLGLDCYGLIWCSYRDAGIDVPDVRRYGREPGRVGLLMATMQEAARSEPIWSGRNSPMEVRESAQPGDMLVFSFEKEPHHVAIVAPNEIHGLGIIHAEGALGHKRVKEHGMMDWHYSRVIAIFRRAV